MTVISPDSELVGAYVTEGSETAFRTLVSRHANLVYSTALRQVSDIGMAEEVTQNVFIALAKKAPRLAGVETLAGWLHRTAILESKARIRSELRRRTREQTAAALAEVERQENTSLEAMVPLVDEALLGLRDADRLALVLRYLENRSLREVGGALGVDEDAARKRVSRALIRVMDFFQHRGFTLPVGMGMAAVLTGTTQAAPAALISASTQMGLTAGKTLSGASLFLFHLMNMGAKKVVVGCIVLASAPLFWQAQVEGKLQRELVALEREQLRSGDQLEEVQRRTAEVSDSLSRLQLSLQNAETRLASINAERTGKVQAQVYQWDDSSPYMRVPKPLLAALPTAVQGRNGKLEVNPTTAEFLQMTEEESDRTRVAVQNFFDGYQRVLIQNARQVEPSKDDLGRRKPDEVRVFEVSDMKEQVAGLRETFFGELQVILGAERFSYFRDALEQWMPIDSKDYGMNSARAVVSYAHRQIFFKPASGANSLHRRFERERGNMSGSVRPDDIPDAFAAELQDWIALAQRKSPDKTSLR